MFQTKLFSRDFAKLLNNPFPRFRDIQQNTLIRRIKAKFCLFEPPKLCFSCLPSWVPLDSRIAESFNCNYFRKEDQFNNCSDQATKEYIHKLSPYSKEIYQMAESTTYPAYKTLCTQKRSTKFLFN
jgi:hypothetical protein